ncbi:MAG: M56 family metallopeptidase [Oscillospiraceae bacterium]|nr:M56 family metallopeptidase [Oscillospiraceae bacterium]
MESVFSLILDMSLTASFVIFAILLIRQLLKKAPKKYSYALWLVAAFRLICPVSIESAFSIFNLKFGKSGASLTDVPTYLPPTNIAPAQPAPSIAPSGSAAIVLPNGATNIGTAQTVPIVPTEPAASVNMMGVLAIIWCLGIAALLIYSIYTYIKLKRRLSTAVLLQDNIRQASGIRSPFILGFIRPQIYVPYHLSDGEMDYVLAHERFHLKRRDHIIKPLAFLILVLHWFNPLVWLAFYLMVRDMEMSCDEKVLSRDESIRKDYSSTLLSFAAGRSFPAPSPLSFGEGSVKSRIKNILNWKKPALWLTVAAIVICAAVIAVCGTNARISLPADKISEVSANGETIPSEAAEDLIDLINSHSKTAYHKAPAEVGNADSRVAITFEDGSSYYLHHWYCSGFSFNPAHFGEDDYYTILSRLDENGNPVKSWKMEYSFDKVFLDWLEKYSANNLHPFGSEFTLSEAIFTRDNGAKLSFETAEGILLDSSRTLYAGSEPLGSFEQITLSGSNWDNYLTGARGTWLTYSAKELRRHNSRAWRIVNSDRYYYLLLQDDGTLYLAGGYYDAEGEYDSESDDSNIFCIYELAGEGSAIRWQYVQYEQPDYFPLDFDFEYSSIRFVATEGSIRAIDAAGYPLQGVDVEVSAQCSEIGWVHPIDANMSASLRQEGNREKIAPFAEVFFTATLSDGETLSGTLIISRPDKRDRYLYEITLDSDTLGIKRAPKGGAVIYVTTESVTAPAADIYAPISCLYMAPHSSYYPWGGDSGCRYIIDSDSIIVERMDGSSSEVIFFDSWNYSVLEPYSEEWTSMFVVNAPTFENIKKPLYLHISNEFFLLNLDGQLCIGEVHDGLVWDIYAIVPEAQLGIAVWEYRPELSSRSPWFEFEFDMEYESLQISSSRGDLFSDGSRYADTQLGLPYGSTVRWSPSAQYDRHSGTQLLFTVNFVDGSMMQGTIYISSENNLYTAVLRADGLHLSNDEDYGHAVIRLTDSSAVIGGTDHASLVANKLSETINMGGSYYLTPHIADHGKQDTLLIDRRSDISGFIRNCRLTPIEAPFTEPSDYWIEISGIISDTKITVWHGTRDTLQLTSTEGTQYYRVDSSDLAAELMEFYFNNAPYVPEFTTDLNELLNKWQAEGVAELSSEKLLLLNRNFVATITGEGNPLSNFFTCYYARTEELNLAAFLQYNFVSSAAYTEEDFYALKQQYPNHGQLDGSDTYEDAVKFRNPIHKFPREKVDEQLMRYMGITTADITAEIDLENSGLVYLAEADAYFNFTSDMGAGIFRADSGKIVGDTVYLRSGFATLTLRKNGDTWLIYSHTYDTESATRAYISNGILEIFDVDGQMDITEYSDNGAKGAVLTITDRETAERYSRMLQSCIFTKVDAPAEPIDVPRLEFTPTQPTNRLIIWDSETPLLRYSPRGRHEYYTFTSDVWDNLYDELYKSFDGRLQQMYLEENSTYTTDLNDLLNKWQAEGVTTLSQEQCTQLSKNFIPTSWNKNGPGIASVNPLSGFFSYYYERPEDIDLKEFLRYNFDLDIGFTEDDFNLLRQYKVQIADLSADETYEDAVRMQTPIHKYPRKKVDALLTKYAGITTADLSSEPNMVYLDEFNSYYNFTSDYGPIPFNCYAGKIDGDMVYLSDGSATLTLRKNVDEWLIYSHIFYGSVELH